jgi:hypothetical protein
VLFTANKFFRQCLDLLVNADFKENYRNKKNVVLVWCTVQRTKVKQRVLYRQKKDSLQSRPIATGNLDRGRNVGTEKTEKGRQLMLQRH